MVLQVENLCKKYGNKVVLEQINLQVREGEIFGLLGPNGSGKTTMIHCILSLLKFESGSIQIFDQLMYPRANDLKRKLGYVPQNISVFDELTVFDNIYYFCSLYINNMKEALCLTEKAMELTGLVDYRKFYPKKLSGGLLKRLNLACGIAHNPKFVILDEPTISADIHSRNKIMEVIKELQQKGTTIFYATHYGEEVESLCERTAIIDRGKILAVGTKAELKSMISLGERIRVKVENLTDSHKKDIKILPNVYDVGLEQGVLVVKSKRGEDTLVHLMSYLQEQEIAYRWVHTERPTLNDVFLEITGRTLGE